MSKKTLEERIQTDGVRCELISSSDVSYLEGKLKTLIDASIVDEKQNKATKDMVRLVLWDWFTFIRDHILDHLKDKKEWYKKNKTMSIGDCKSHKE